MQFVSKEGRRVIRGSGGPSSPAIYVIDSPDHPVDLESLARGRRSSIVTVPVVNWNDALTPWPAQGLYREGSDFGGQADVTLTELCDEAIPAIEQDEGLCPSSRAICGYSLGGLFALYAFTHTELFSACACLSGSVWYEGWVEHLRELGPDLSGRFAYLSLGTKERRAAQPILKTVQDRMEACAKILHDRGTLVEYRTGPGNHMQHVPERFDAGLTALDAFLTSAPTKEPHGA